jgi:CBS domain-containing protein
MKAADVMTTNVFTVGPDASVQDVAVMLLANRISAVPVVGKSGELLGIVSEGDLMRRAEAGTGRRRTWWLAMLTSKQALAADYVMEHSRKVTDVMSRAVVTATPETPLHQIADLLEKNRIKRVPIVDSGKVVGIVSRANLLQALASRGKAEPEVAPSDATIRNDVIAQLSSQPWTRLMLINVIVQDGCVDLWGIVDSEEERKAVRVAAEVTPGVRKVNDKLAVQQAGTWS